MYMQPAPQLGFLLQHTAAALTRKSDEVLQERFGIGYSQYKILLSLEANPEVQQRTIAESLAQTEASISRQIKVMIDKGLLQSRVNPNNKRQHIVTPTSRGRKIAAEATDALDYHTAPIFAALTVAQQRDLIELLTTIHYGVCSPH